MTATKVDVTEQQLAELMDQLEAETGLSAAIAPATASAPPVVEVDDEELSELAALEEEETASPTVFSDAEIAESEKLLEQTKIKVTDPKPKADLSNLQSELAGLAEANPNDDDELAELAELEASDDDDVEETKPAAVEAKKTIEPSAAADTERAEKPETSEPVGVPKVSVTVKGACPVEAPKSPGLKFFVDPDQFKKETQIKGHDLDTCFMQQSSLRAYYGTMAASAEAQASRSKIKFEVLEARLYDHHRKVMTDSGAKVTEKAVENAVKTDSRWLTGKETVIDADTISAVNKALAISLADRRDMLIQLGADRRDESKGQARMMAVKAEQENMTMRASSAATALKKN